MASSAVGDEQVTYADYQMAPYLSALNDQIQMNKNFLNNSIEAAGQSLKALTHIDPDTGLPQAYVMDELTGLAKSMAQYRQYQADVIQDYAGMLDSRTEELAELWGERVQLRTSTFLETGSIYDEIMIDVNIEEPIFSTSFNPVYPNLSVSVGGFFANK